MQNKRQSFLFSLPRRILYWAKPKIVQTEDKAKQNTKFLFCFVEVQPIFAAQRQCIKTNTNHTNYTNDAQYLFV